MRPLLLALALACGPSTIVELQDAPDDGGVRDCTDSGWACAPGGDCVLPPADGGAGDNHVRCICCTADAIAFMSPDPDPAQCAQQAEIWRTQCP